MLVYRSVVEKKISLTNMSQMGTLLVGGFFSHPSEKYAQVKLG